MEQGISQKMGTRSDDLAGAISVNFPHNEDFKTFCQSRLHVDGARYEPVAMRVYVEEVFMLTIFAKETNTQTLEHESIGVKKFKFEMDKDESFYYSNNWILPW